jgi:hypothetical protein
MYALRFRSSHAKGRMTRWIVLSGRRFHSSFTAVEIRNMAHRHSDPRGVRAASTMSLPAIVSAAALAGCATLVAAAEPGTTGAAPINVVGDAAVAPATAAVSRPNDQVWLVSSRGVTSSRHDDDLEELTYSVHQSTTGWTTANEDTFRAAPATTTTCVLVLGNGYTASETRSLGQTAYRRLTAALPPERPMCFVIWSWPSDHTDAGPIKDLRIKAARTPRVAYCLARWLDEVPSPGQVSLLGTSFGARIIMEALELRAGGKVGNVRLDDPADRVRPKVDVVLISAAIDSDWLLPGRRLGGSLSQADRLLLVNNSSDSTLKRYHWLYGRRSNATALSTTGLRSRNVAATTDLAQIDAAPIIGRHHGCGPYFESPRLLAAMRSYLFSERTQSPEIPTEGLPIPVAANGMKRGGWGRAAQ